MAKRLIRKTLPVLLLLQVGGCSWGLGGGDPEMTEMHRHFTRTLDIQTGVIVGDLDRASAAGEWLAKDQGLDAVYPEARGYLETLRAEARLISGASELGAVAGSAGRMAAACGACHEATGGGPNFVLGSPPPEGDSEAATMIRHIWAADRMWEGLLSPSSGAWEAGAQALERGWGAYGESIQASPSPERAQRYITEVRELARQASAAGTQDARGEAYGNLLGTCNGCHATMGRGAGEPTSLLSIRFR